MMDEQIGVSLNRVRDCILRIKQSKFTTADVLRKYLGHFSSDIGTEATYSFNAQFGALLKRNCDYLGIKELEKNISIEDDHGHKTTSSLWSIST
ncbi:MAG: hypothetical protein HQK84_04145 [Nitrospinae bacterium]|nr:hypothetical protein [Nitrospinota bacterium]